MPKRVGIRHIICISDLHAGSSVSVCPPDVTLDDGGIYRYSKYQKVLWEWWNEFWYGWVPAQVDGEPFSVVINGDVLDGKHHETTTIISANLADQQKIAEKLLRPICELTPRLIIVRGTEAHAGKTGQHEEQLAQALGAVGPEPWLCSWWEYKATLNDNLIHFAHHIGVTSSAAYRSSALMRTIANNFVDAGQWGTRPPDLIVRSHRHRQTEVVEPTKNGVCRIVVTPGWQLKTPFIYRTGQDEKPQIGGICISASGSSLKVRSRTWTPKDREPENLDAITLTRSAGSCGMKSRQCSNRSRKRKATR
jgi:hypothetical protein